LRVVMWGNPEIDSRIGGEDGAQAGRRGVDDIAKYFDEQARHRAKTLLTRLQRVLNW